ncbi:MAG: 5-methyltetrahydropteroyltriglutamate--homocysteine methyltransferase [Alphaproteobacteria bacterium]|jgi:5-methyltetrahydropteroyltriglutamate--homocysteine methyltransferase|nr:5-methyltetrahydropteroyltriglutamate--homocysteine methyltransferase [Alphaproteobacteria bacterium]
MTNLKTIRTDVVGSLLRPAGLKEARAAFDDGKLSAEEFRSLEDAAVRSAVALQEAAGLDVVTDGEMRRLNFQDSFGAAVEGFDASRSTLKGYERRVEGSAPLQRWEIPTIQETGTAVSHRRPTKARLRLARNVPLEEYSFVSKVARKPAKVSLIGADRISQRFDHQASTAVYRGMDEFVADVVAIERAIVESLVAAGCRYIHIDAPGFTAYVDPPSLAQMRARGEDPEQNFARSLKAEAAVVAGLGEVATAIHLCRGNQRSMWHREGSYDAIAERLFSELPHDRFLLEYDSPRAGSFEALRFVPKGKVVVLGLVSTKVPELEKVEDLKRRIDEAARHIALDQLAISPQCGFASDVVGNLLSADDQKRKLERVAETARQVWG